MTIVPRSDILAALSRALASKAEDQAVAAVAAQFALPEEAVREVLEVAEPARQESEVQQ